MSTEILKKIKKTTPNSVSSLNGDEFQTSAEAEKIPAGLDSPETEGHPRVYGEKIN